MRNALDIVRGAVSPRDAVPILTHFAFRDCRAYGFNGRVCISAPAKELAGLALTVPADKLIAALDRADGKWSLTHKGAQLLFRSGGFRVLLPVGDIAAFPLPELPGKKARQKITPGLLEALRRLAPLVGEDASRPWSSAVKVSGATAMATNNVVFAEVSLPATYPEMELPIHAITELSRLDIEPTHVAVEPNAVTFFFPGEIWLRAQLFTEKWPDARSALSSIWTNAAYTRINADKLAAAVKCVQPFCPDPAHPVIVLAEDKVRTVAGEMAAEVTGFTALGNCAFRAEPLLLVLAEANEMDLSRWPRVPWRGQDIHGVIVGVTSS